MQEPIKPSHRAASEVLGDVVKTEKDSITFADLNRSLHERGFGIVMLLFSLPLVFVPPGMTTIACIPVALFSLQMLLGFDTPWMPKWLGKKSIKRTTLAFVVTKATPILLKAERVLKNRLNFIASKKGERIFGMFALIFSLSIGIPLPLTNLIPAIGIAIMALGLLSRDGLVIIVGKIVGIIGCMITFSVLFFGAKFITELFEQISSWFSF